MPSVGHALMVQLIHFKRTGPSNLVSETQRKIQELSVQVRSGYGALSSKHTHTHTLSLSLSIEPFLEPYNSLILKGTCFHLGGFFFFFLFTIIIIISETLKSGYPRS
jgi:hypothetical protein